MAYIRLHQLKRNDAHAVLHAPDRAEHIGGGGLEPSAASPEHWDLVPPTGTHRAMRAKSQRVNGATAQSSKSCTKKRRSAPGLSIWKRQRLPIAQGIDLRPKSQPVNACKPNGPDAQAARQRNMGAMAGSPGGIGDSDGWRQSSASRAQTSAIMQRAVEAASAANWPAPSNEIAKRSTALYPLYRTSVQQPPSVCEGQVSLRVPGRCSVTHGAPIPVGCRTSYGWKCELHSHRHWRMCRKGTTIIYSQVSAVWHPGSPQRPPLA